jgi:hypothetical protein
MRILQDLMRIPNYFIYGRRLELNPNPFNYWMYELKVLKNASQIVDIICRRERLETHYCQQAFVLRDLVNNFIEQYPNTPLAHRAGIELRKQSQWP